MIEKTEKHIVSLPEHSDDNLCLSLGKMVIAFGRLEDMLKVCIKRIRSNENLSDIIEEFSGMKGTLDRLIDSNALKGFSSISAEISLVQILNKERQDFIHATFAHDEDTNSYVRFRKLVAYKELEQDIKKIDEITTKVNSLIDALDKKTVVVDKPHELGIITTVSAVSTRTK